MKARLPPSVSVRSAHSGGSQEALLGSSARQQHQRHVGGFELGWRIYEAQQGYGWYIADWKRIAATVQVIPLEGSCSSRQRGCRHACALYECAGRSRVRVREFVWADVAANTLAHHMWEPGHVSKWSCFRRSWGRLAQIATVLAGQWDRSPDGFAAVVFLVYASTDFRYFRSSPPLSPYCAGSCRSAHASYVCVFVCVVCIFVFSSCLVLRGAERT